VEFTIEPFLDGNPGPHVVAAIEAVRALGFEPDLGPFGTSIEGDATSVIEAIDALLTAAGEAGAARVSIQLEYLPA
jgi:uncharacterized protein YqgV (UPF0045/DUF77 family)